MPTGSPLTRQKQIPENLPWAQPDPSREPSREPLAMITLRLPEAVRAELTSHAHRRKLSVNHWILQAAMAQLELDRELDEMIESRR